MEFNLLNSKLIPKQVTITQKQEFYYLQENKKYD